MIVGGIYHNFIIPMVNPTVDEHQDGLVIMLLAYVILSSLMVYLYVTTTAKRNHIIGGMMVGGIIGFLWTFPMDLPWQEYMKHQLFMKLQTHFGMYLSRLSGVL